MRGGDGKHMALRPWVWLNKKLCNVMSSKFPDFCKQFIGKITVILPKSTFHPFALNKPSILQGDFYNFTWEKKCEKKNSSPLICFLHYYIVHLRRRAKNYVYYYHFYFFSSLCTSFNLIESTSFVHRRRDLLSWCNRRSRLKF